MAVLAPLGGDGAWLILILLLFAAFNGNGWGGNGGNNFVPYNADLQRGFDQQSVMGGIGGIQGSLAAMTTQNCSDAYNTLLAIQNSQNALNQSMNSIAMAQQNCCCENRAAIADLKYNVATEACADRNAISMGVRDIIQNQNQGIQTIMDKLCQRHHDDMMDGSYMRGRSPVTGRYISRDGYQMSGHSLRDRMVAKLEEMYDSAATEYEREELRKEIRRIEAEK